MCIDGSPVCPKIVFEQERFDRPASPDEDDCRHSYAVWKPQKSHRDGGPVAWRMDSFLGFRGVEDTKKRKPPHVEPPSHPDVVVIVDTNLGFRSAASRESRWPAAIKSSDGKDKPWVLLKATSPLAEGDLWEHLINRQPDRLVVVTAMHDLRQAG